MTKMTNRFRVSTALIRRLENVGLQPLAVCARRACQWACSIKKRSSSHRRAVRLYRGISEVSRDPAIGLKMATEERVERYDPVSIAALYAKTFRDALQRLARYKQLTCPEEIRVPTRRRMCGSDRWLLAEEKAPDFLIDICFAWIVVIGRRGTGRLVNPSASNCSGPRRTARCTSSTFSASEIRSTTECPCV